MKNINTQEYWEKRYARGNYILDRSHRTLFKEVLDWVPKGALLLDVGCGVGHFLKLASAVCNAKCFGADFSKTAIRHLSKTTTAAGIVGFAERLPFAENSFDSVSALELLEHLNDRERKQVLREISRVCRNQGLVLLTVPLCPVGMTDRHPEHVVSYSLDSFDDELSAFFEERNTWVSKTKSYLLSFIRVQK